jgi:hypothetical protein
LGRADFLQQQPGVVFPRKTHPAHGVRQHLGDQRRQLVFLALHDATQIKTAGDEHEDHQAEDQSAEGQRKTPVDVGEHAGIDGG